MATKTYFDALLGLLGSKQVIGAKDMDYGDWTPNDVKSIVLLPSLIYIEYHTHNPRFNTFATPLDMAKTPVSVFTMKQFGCLEDLVVHRDLYVDGLIQKAFPPNTRLRGVLVAPLDIAGEMASNFVGYATETYNSDAITPLLNRVPPSTWEGSFPVLDRVEGYTERFVLFPQLYRSDVKGGKLETLLRNLQVSSRPAGVLSNEELSKLRQMQQHDMENMGRYHTFINKILESPDDKKALWTSVIRSTVPTSDELTQIGTIGGFYNFLEPILSWDSAATGVTLKDVVTSGRKGILFDSELGNCREYSKVLNKDCKSFDEVIAAVNQGSTDTVSKDWGIFSELMEHPKETRTRLDRLLNVWASVHKDFQPLIGYTYLTPAYENTQEFLTELYEGNISSVNALMKFCIGGPTDQLEGIFNWSGTVQKLVTDFTWMLKESDLEHLSSGSMTTKEVCTLIKERLS